MEQDETKIDMEELIAELCTQTETKILRSFFGFDDPMDYNQLSVELDVSLTRVYQVKDRGLRKIKTYLLENRPTIEGVERRYY